MKKYLSAGILVLLAIFVIRSGSVFDTKLLLSSILNNSIGDLLESKKDLKENIAFLETENERLRRELVRYNNENLEDIIKVYSSYPFNSRGEIAIAAGQNIGLEKGDTVIYQGGVFVGRIRSVFRSSSVVTTIFDPSWELAVRIGNNEVDALMRGGNELKLVLIPEGALIETGDIVVSADSNFPYGLIVGFVGEIRNKEGDIFQEATIEPSIHITEIRDVSVSR